MENKNPEVITKNRIIFLIIFIVICFVVIILKLGYLQLFNIKASLLELNKLSTKTVYGPSMPRGRIYDRNYNVIVDNVGTNLISYKKESEMKTSDEIKIAYKLAEKLDVNYSDLKDRNLREFYLANNKEKGDAKITDEEEKLYERRKIKASEIENLKLERITDEELATYTNLDKEAAYIYYLMNNGYYYDEKTIKDNATDEEYAYVAQNLSELKGVSISTSWQRIYPYGDTLRQILGNVSTSKTGIPEEYKAEYLNKGYSLNDRV